MKVQNFLNTLKLNPGKELSYRFKGSFTVAPHTHITEIKQQSIRSVDCGGKQNAWSETVMQWWAAASEDDGHRVSSTKVLEIFDRVNQVSSIDMNTELLLEYADKTLGVAYYMLNLSSIDNDTIYFELIGGQTQCKASSTCGTKSNGCGSSKNKQQAGCCA
ncbi:MAG: hypothetical protein ACI9ES_001100 [Oceanospirillaceae bacterium]|jgi:hypothetical protein